MVSLFSSSLLSSVSSSSSATYSQEVLGEVNSQTLSLHYLPIVAEFCVCSYPDVWGWVGKDSGSGRPPQLPTLHHSCNKSDNQSPRAHGAPIAIRRFSTAGNESTSLTSLDVKPSITAPLSESVYSSSFCGQRPALMAISRRWPEKCSQWHEDFLVSSLSCKGFFEELRNITDIDHHTNISDHSSIYRY